MNVPPAAKKVISAAESMGFTIITREFPYHKDAVLWAKTEGDHVAGNIRSPEKNLDGIQIIGYRTDSRLGFDVTYAGGFDIAYVLDPVGRYRELAADYTFSNDEIKRRDYTRKSDAEALAAKQDAEYNDGADYKQYEWFIKGANEFYAWIDEWLKLLQSEHEPIAPKPRAPKKTKAEVAEEAAAEREVMMLSGGDWSAE